jgi:hypothetical protein
MTNVELFMLKSNIAKATSEIKKLKNENNLLDESISQLKTENKSLYSSEYQLIHMILQYEKKLHEFANAKQNYMTNMNSLKTEFQALNLKLNSLRDIKTSIIESNKNKVKHYMRMLYKLNIRNEKRVCSFGTFSCLADADIIDTNLEEITEKIKLRLYTSMLPQLKNLASNVPRMRKLNEENKAYICSKLFRLYSKIEATYPDITYPVISNDNFDIDKLRYYKSKLEYFNKKFNLDLAIATDDSTEQAEKFERTEKQLESLLLNKRNLKIKKM